MSKNGRRKRKGALKKKMGLTRRRFLGLLAGSAISAGVGSWLVGHRSPSFQEARADESLRKAYIDHIAEPLEKLEYVGDIVYREGESPVEGSGIVIDFEYKDIGEKKKFNLNVYSATFEDRAITSENDFLSVLVDHEVEHTRNLHHGFEWFNKNDFLGSPGKYNNVIDNILELVAYGNQLKKRHERGISEKTLEHTLGKYYEQYSILIHPTRDNATANRETMQKIRERLFLEDFLNLTANLGGEKHEVIIPNGVMNTKYGPVKLPKSIVEKHGLK